MLAEDGLVGLDMFDPDHSDLLLLDLNLPGKGGWDVVERITSVSPLLPIIVITGQPNQCEMATAAGVGALMGKPLDVPFLLQTITELLDEPAEQRLERLVGRLNHLRLSPPCNVQAAVATNKRVTTTASRKRPGKDDPRLESARLSPELTR